ncbi:MerR family transcriptional regulator [Bacillus safensis]|uniref:MerR family transcriptional regulator n=1 Tax=Bacillus safensis TaxID=561879 RepID=UPI00046AC322|nr:MerR family transcriptional regulator [Bacillus safensis]
MYSVKEVAQKLNLTEHTIRYYTDRNLIPSIKRDKNNNRVFDQESINWLIGVRFLKESGMSIKEIKAYNDLCLVGDSTIPERLEIILNRKKQAVMQLEEIKKSADYLEQKAKQYDDIIKGKGLAIDKMNPNKWTI